MFHHDSKRNSRGAILFCGVVLLKIQYGSTAKAECQATLDAEGEMHTDIVNTEEAPEAPGTYLHACGDTYQDLGWMTLGISFGRSGTVEQGLSKMVGSYFGAVAETILDSKYVEKYVGTDYQSLSETLAKEAAPGIEKSLKEFQMKVISTGNKTSAKAWTTPSGKTVGVVLLEFKVCGPADYSGFFKCLVLGKGEHMATGRLADWFGKAFETANRWGGQSMKRALVKQIMKGMDPLLPGNVKKELTKGGVADANVCYFERQMGDDLFEKVAKCKQAPDDVPEGSCEDKAAQMREAAKAELPCVEKGAKYMPLNMKGRPKTEDKSLIECARLCHEFEYCAHFTWFVDGSCHVQDNDAKREDDVMALTGDRLCAAAPHAPELAADTALLTDE